MIGNAPSAIISISLDATSVTVVLPTALVAQVVTTKVATAEEVTVVDTEVVATAEAVTAEAVTVADTEVVVTAKAEMTVAVERPTAGQNKVAMEKFAVVAVTVGYAVKARPGISVIFLPLIHSIRRSVTIEVSSWQVKTKSVLKSTISMQSRRRRMTTEKVPFPVLDR